MAEAPTRSVKKVDRWRHMVAHWKETAPRTDDETGEGMKSGMLKKLYEKKFGNKSTMQYPPKRAPIQSRTLQSAAQWITEEVSAAPNMKEQGGAKQGSGVAWTVRRPTGEHAELCQRVRLALGRRGWRTRLRPSSSIARTNTAAVNSISSFSFSFMSFLLLCFV